MTSKTFTVWTKAALTACLAVFVAFGSLSFGQQLTGTLSGTTMDSSGAVVANAKVTMKNDLSGDVRTTVSNSSGFFSITAVQPGTYSVTVSAAGFKTWTQSGIVFAQGDNRNLPNIALQVGGVNETVEITAGALAVPTDNAEVSTTINQTLISDVPIVGRDAGELIKLMPGVASTNGINQGSTFSDKVTGSNSGPVGAYSINGTQPNGAMAFMLDGANLVDPGNLGTQIANINQDMVSEVKFLTSSYSAEYAKGPVIFQAFSKSGGASFHGEGYLYARNSALNSIDWYTRNQISKGATTAALAAPDESFYYMGGNIGGPIRLPFSGFNKNHDKLFFWAGYEYMRQHPAGSINNYNVPTPAQKGNDPNNPGFFVFDESTVAGATLDPTSQGYTGGQFNTNAYAYQHPQWSLPNNAQAFLANGTPAIEHTDCDATGKPNCTKVLIPTSDMDPLFQGILGLYPDPNITPSSSNGWNNYQYVTQVPQNRWEATGKVDYAINENTKLTGSYTRQIETAQHPLAIWWAPPWTLPYPSGVVAKQTSQMIMANLTHVFSPTTTNEFVFTLARYINPSQLTNQNAVSRSALGFNVQGLFGHTTKQIPNFVTDSAWVPAFPDIQEFSFDGSFNGGGTFGGLKRDPAIYDNFTKVIGSHTLKFGAYWDTQENIQSASGQDNGVYNLGWPSAGGTNNIVTDALLGHIRSYTQASAVPVDDVKFHQWSVYAQDSFKANRQLTLNYGLRFDHVGQWYGMPKGIQVWDPSSYTNDPAAENPGIKYHSIDSSVPLSGFSSPLFYYEPRIGLAYDVFGTGKTVLRAGYAVFHYQISTEVCGNNACDGPAGTVNYQTPTSFIGYGNISQFTPPTTAFENGGNIGVLQRGDNRTPLTMDWNVTVSQALPWRSVFELSYVANKTQNEFTTGGNGNYLNLNNINPGGLFLPDPITGQICSGAAPTGSGVTACNAQDFRPLQNYGQKVLLYTHQGFANYNSLQAAWQKQSGPVDFLLNYTFSKVLGTRDWNSDNGASSGILQDPFSLRNNYGVLAYDHTHVLNASYVWNLPKVFRNNHMASAVVDGWQLTGYTTYSSGAPLQPNTGGNLNASWPGGLPQADWITLPNGLPANGMNPSTWFGTDAYNAIVPVITCNPRQHASGLSFNPNCFGPPAYGRQGDLNWPYLRVPGYFDSDLGLFKSFNITERQKVQFRLSAVNFLNHPNPQFNTGGIQDANLKFTNPDGSLSQTNTNTLTTGKPVNKVGQRTLTFALKYYF